MTRRGATQPGFLRALTEGRSGRQQFWSFYVFVAVPPGALILASFAFQSLNSARLLIVYAVTWVMLFALPLVIAMARRFHDIGRTGLWALPQFGIAFAVFVIAVAYPTVFERPTVPECRPPINLFLGLGARSELNRRSKTEAPAEREARTAACEEQRTLQNAYDDRKGAAGYVSLALMVLAHIATLAVLARPSDPNANRHGPNPQEVAT